MLDEDRALEVFPMFADTSGGGAPRVFDLTRTGAVIAGTQHRRYEQRLDVCEAHVPVHVTACKDDRLEIVTAEPAPPLQWQPCEWSAPQSQVLRWQRDQRF